MIVITTGRSFTTEESNQENYRENSEIIQYIFLLFYCTIAALIVLVLGFYFVVQLLEHQMNPKEW